ncbi:MAG: MATE family efflux transporter [Oscillospiraceae bacterium]
MNVDYSEDFGFKKYIKILMPSIWTMIFVSFYSVIDSFFVGRFVSSDAMAAINITMPIINFNWGIGIMIAVGSSSYVAIKLGEGKKAEADNMFTKMSVFILILGVTLSLLFVLFLKPIVKFLGATDIIYKDTYTYAFYICITSTVLLFKLFFEYYVRVDGKSNLSLAMSFVGLLLNIILDYLFVVVFKLGILGASIATAISIFISMSIGLFYFLLGRSNLKFIKISKFKYFLKDDIKFILKSIINGSSEMFNEVSGAFIIFVFNGIVLRASGENGVASFSIIMNVYYFVISIFLGIAFGAQPILSYNYGAGNKEKMLKYIKQSGVLIFVLSGVASLLSFLFAQNIAQLFVVDNVDVVQMATVGIEFFSLAFLIFGFNIFLSTMYTAVGNGKVSAFLSSLRSFLFVFVLAYILPKFIGMDGIWLSIPLSETISIFISLIYFFKFKKLYL